MADSSPLLPEVLASGAVLIHGDSTVSIIRTSKRDEYGQRLYRLRHSSRISADGWAMPGVAGKTLYSRDRLQELGMVLDCGGKG